MKSIERFSTVFLGAGLILFLGAILSLGIIPAWMVDELYPMQGVGREIPPEFEGHFESVEKYQSAVLRGRDIYIAEACWHCHSQFVRPAGNENLRYGPVSTAGEFQSVLHLPQLLGTRRVGPDLSREAGLRSNDWHYAHLYNPRWVVPDSVMPEYSWFFTVDEQGVPTPTEDAVALVAYLQQLGWQHRNRMMYSWERNGMTMPPIYVSEAAQKETEADSSSSESTDNSDANSSAGEIWE